MATHWITMVRRDLDGMVAIARRGTPAGESVEVHIQCHQHSDGSSIVKYEDGLISVECHECARVTAVVRVAEVDPVMEKHRSA